MERDTLKSLLEQWVTRLKSGQQVEDPKVEFKREWYKFKNPPATSSSQAEESEFLKDVIGIANTPGLTGYLAIGLDKQGNISHEPFNNSGMRDQTELRGLVVKYVDRPADFELHEIALAEGATMKTVSVLVIPPSINKPHVIGRYVSAKGTEIVNYIPIRKNTGIWPASRSDIDFMYYDRKNLEPEFALDIISYNPPIYINGLSNSVMLDFQLAFRNHGRKPIALASSTLTIEFTEHQQEIELRNSYLPPKLEFHLSTYGEYGAHDRHIQLQSRYLKVGSNEVEALQVRYMGTFAKDVLEPLRSLREIFFSVTAIDIEGHEFTSARLTGRHS